MSSAPLSELYALALRTLDAHERRVGDLRARLAPVLAAGGIGMTLLARPAFEGTGKGDPLAIAALACALMGMAVALLGATSMLLHRSEHLGPDAHRLMRQMSGTRAIEDHDTYNREMIAVFATHAESQEIDFDAQHRTFTRILCGMLFMLCGLAVGALVG